MCCAHFLGTEGGSSVYDTAPPTGGRVCSSVLDTNPCGMGGSRRGGGVSKNFLHFGGIFEFPVSF